MRGTNHIFAVLVAAGILFSGAVASAGPSQKGPQFLTVLQDVPLMPGLEEQIDEAVVFDKPSGRIAESMAVSGGVSEDAIDGFYSRTLPQLGWSLTDAGSYIRKDEELRIVVAMEDGVRVVRFTVTPR